MNNKLSSLSTTFTKSHNEYTQSHCINEKLWNIVYGILADSSNVCLRVGGGWLKRFMLCKESILLQAICAV